MGIVDIYTIVDEDRLFCKKSINRQLFVAVN